MAKVAAVYAVFWCSWRSESVFKIGTFGRSIPTFVDPATIHRFLGMESPDKTLSRCLTRG